MCVYIYIYIYIYVCIIIIIKHHILKHHIPQLRKVPPRPPPAASRPEGFRRLAARGPGIVG